MATTDPGGVSKEHLGIAYSEWLDPQSAALVLIDIQNYVVARKYDVARYHPFANSAATEAYFQTVEEVCLPAVRRLLGCFRSRSLPVIYLRYCSHEADYRDMPMLWRKVSGEMRDAEGHPYSLLPDREATQIISEIAPLAGETVLDKTTNGGFASTKLDLCLRSLNIRNLVNAGGWTNACVETTVREACDKGYLCVVASDACFSPVSTIHEASLENLDAFYALVLDTEEIEKNLG